MLQVNTTLTSLDLWSEKRKENKIRIKKAKEMMND